MIVADSGNNRIMIWNTTPSKGTSSNAPDVILGGAIGCAMTEFAHPEGVLVVGGNLVVTDTDNNRIMIYSGIPTKSSDVPKVVLGDPSASSCSQSIPDIALGPLGPVDTVYDGHRLIVADYWNNRIIMWTTSDITTLSDGQAPDIILGPSDISQPGAQAKFDGPRAIALRNQEMAVLDQMNNRILVWKQIPTCTGTPAAPCLASYDSPPPLEINQQIGYSRGLSFIGLNQLMLTDEGNHRFSVFTATAP